MTRALVYGLAITGDSVVRALLRRDVEVVVADDVVTDERRARAAELGVELVERPDDGRLRALLTTCDLLSPAPGLPETHRAITTARALDVEIASEIDLAYRWEQTRDGGPRPMLAITGTDGKTTTTLLAVEMLRAAGLSTVDAGNTSTPLVDAIESPHDAFVVECTSFRLAATPTFRAEAAAWLNLAPDHLNWHASMASYEAAKARIWANQRPSDVAIGYAADRADYHLDGDLLVGPAGPIATRSAMRRSLPHDVTNALAAAALVLETGLAGTDDVGRALATFTGPPHRLEHLGRWDDVDWYNDSKATTPHAAAAAIRAFDDVVLIAGGKDKRVDLAEMAVDRDRLRALIAIGETREAMAAAFVGVPIVVTAEHLDEAVELARAHATAGSTVLLSPGCASLDQYASFEARGDRFRQLVADLHDQRPNPGVA